MSAEDKANELVEWFNAELVNPPGECAIKVCDEVLSTFSHHMTTKIKYWQAVKTAITKL